MKTILVIDDDDDMRHGIMLTLQSNGYNTIEADDGVSGLKRIQEEHPDLVVSDVMMPNMNGYMLLEMVKDDPRTSKIPIMLITGAAFDAGAWKSDNSVAYLEKPFASEKFISTIERMLKSVL